MSKQEIEKKLESIEDPDKRRRVKEKLQKGSDTSALQERLEDEPEMESALVQSGATAAHERSEDEFYEDYREVDGRMVPFRAVTWVDGSQLLDATTKSFEFDPEVDPTRFEKPAA